jgi:hypothetical protein
MKVKFEVKILKMSAVEMTIIRKIGDFPNGVGKAFLKGSMLFRIPTALLFHL